MKTLTTTFFLLFTRLIYAGTPSIVTEKGVTFATHLVNGSTFYNFADAQTHWQELGNISSVTVIVTTFTPTSFETNLSTCLATPGINFASYTDWLNCQTKSGLREKMASFRHKLTGYSFDTNSPQYIDMAQRFDWLKSYYQSLP